MITITVRNKNTWTGKGYHLPTSPLMNPFKISNGQTRDDVIKRYGAMLISAIQKRDQKITMELMRIENHVRTNKSIDLICECSPKDCHGEIIKQVILNKIVTNYWLINQPCPTCKRSEFKIGVYGL